MNRQQQNNSRDSLLAMIRNGSPMSMRQQLLLTATLSWPAIVSQLSAIIMQYIDAAMVGSLGTSASASIGLMATSTWLFWGLCTAAGMGFSVQAAHRIGANDIEGARSVLRQSLSATAVVSIVLILIGLLISSDLPRWLGGTPDITPDASVYFTIFVITLPAAQFNFLAGAMLRCSGNTLVPGIINVAMCALDVVFNLFLIFPEHQLFSGAITLPGAGLGVAGAALGTGLAEIVACSITMTYLWRYNKDLRLRGFKGSFRPQRQCIRRAVRIGAPIGAEHVLFSGAQVLTTVIVAPLGPIAIAANSFAVTAESLCYMPGFGISEAATTLVGQSLGAGRKQLTRRFATITVSSGVIIMTLMGIIMYLAAPLMMEIISPVKEICDMGVEALRIEAWAEPMYAASIVAYGVMVGAGDTLIPCGMNLGSIWGVRLTLAAVLAPIYGLNGVWFAMAFELCFRGVIFLCRLRSDAWMRAVAKIS